MRSVYVAAAAGILLAGCSVVGRDFPFMGREGSAESSLPVAAYSGDTDSLGDRNVLALRQSAWNPARIRGDGAASNNAADFCKAVAVSDADSTGYDPATSRRVEATQLAQCRALIEP